MERERVNVAVMLLCFHVCSKRIYGVETQHCYGGFEKDERSHLSLSRS